MHGKNEGRTVELNMSYLLKVQTTQLIYNVHKYFVYVRNNIMHEWNY